MLRARVSRKSQDSSRFAPPDDRPALLELAADGHWDAARDVMMAGMQVLSRNLLAAWPSPEAHEHLVYQQWMLALLPLFAVSPRRPAIYRFSRSLPRLFELNPKSGS